MPDITQALAAANNALRVAIHGEDLLLHFVKYTNDSVHAKLHDEAIVENFNYQPNRNAERGADNDILNFADVDGIYYSICKEATGCVIDGQVFKLAKKSEPRKYANDDTSFSRIWEWYKTPTGKYFNQS